PKLAESQRLAPGTGALLALALCHEKEGKTASAWAEFREVAPVARRDGRADRSQMAEEHAAALEPKLARLTVTGDPETAGVVGLVVRRDGAEMNRAAWGTPAPVDAGEWRLEASAPGRLPWRTVVTIRDGEDKSVAVPALARADVSPAAT